jgi:hypothetical protein
MAFNPLQNFNQGFASGQQQRISGLQNTLAGQVQQGGFDPASSVEFSQLSVLDPERASATLNTFQSLSKERKKAYHEDLQDGLRALETGDGGRFLDVMNDRLGAIEKLNGDPSGTQFLLNKFNDGAIDELISGLRQTEQAGIIGEFLPDPLGSRKGRSVQSSKILDDGTVIEVLGGGGRQVISPTGKIVTGTEARDIVAAASKKVQQRKIELKKLDQTIKREQAKEGLLTDQQKSIQRGNIKRLGALSNTASGRSSATKKATKFKLALERGEASSGAGRKAAQFIPGVFTSQGQFDEQFNAFAEVAARQQLKASGEVRPTDADVKGMKQAMFGIGRDEAVNIQLLTDFINDQNAQNDELDQLIDASRSGNLGGFTFTAQQPVIKPDLTKLSDDELFN